MGEIWRKIEDRSYMDISLVIMAAGIGSRFGGIKQLEPVGPKGEIIIDYSVHDAIAAGFRRFVIILRREIFADYMQAIGNRMEARFRARGIAWEYVFQELSDPPAGRTKPWGTGQALLSCKDVLKGPFAVINADDYYGQDAYEKAYTFLSSQAEGSRGRYGMVGFVLKNTLSDNGGVTRGLCMTDERDCLTRIDETRNIIKTPTGAAVDVGGELRPLDMESLASMNMWMLTPDFLEVLEGGFAGFRQNLTDPVKDEYLLPDIVDGLLRKGQATVQVLPTNGQWFGVTYREDLPSVRSEIKKLHDTGVYPQGLYDGKE